MAIPLLAYPPSSQNQRVANYEVPGEEKPRVYTTDNLPSNMELDELIKAAYRQVFNEQQLITSNKQVLLESQLRSNQITVRDFIKGLVLSQSFRERNYETNNNYRFVQMCVQRILGRQVYNEREKMAWSTVLATKGLSGFVNDLLNSQEYLSNFGYNTVPYQRRRILPQRTQGELPFARMPRYGADYRAKLEAMGYFKNMPLSYRWEWQKQPYPSAVRAVGQAITVVGATLVSAGIVAVALSAFGLISL